MARKQASDKPVGKNFSMNNLGQRREGDLYETPYSMTRQLLECEPFDRGATTLEPACGNGAIVKVLTEHGFNNVTSYDIETDFLTERGKYEQVITNPPYSIANQFIRKCKEVSETFALLLPLSYLQGKERYHTIWTDRSFPLARVNVFSRYALLGESPREDGKYSPGMLVYAWFVWRRSHQGDASIRWINNDSFILYRKDT